MKRSELKNISKASAQRSQSLSILVIVNVYTRKNGSEVIKSCVATCVPASNRLSIARYIGVAATIHESSNPVRVNTKFRSVAAHPSQTDDDGYHQISHIFVLNQSSGQPIRGNPLQKFYIKR